MNDVMWRNVFSQAIYECIVIAYVIFLAPGKLIPDYWDHCSFDAEGVCKPATVNPFYATNLYYSDADITRWQEQSPTIDEFDPDLLTQW